MSKVSTSEFRSGMVLKLKNKLYEITDFHHVKPGKGGAFIQTKLKGVLTDKTIEEKFRSGEKVEEIRVEQQPHQFLYKDGNLYHFMHQETFEQKPVEESKVEKKEFVTEGQTCTLHIDVDNEEILFAEPPNHIEVKVAKTDPGLRGDTAQGGDKPATLESGAKVQVPLFIDEGETIKVDTRTSEYIERVN